MLTYGGEDLCLPTPEVSELLRIHFPMADRVPWARPQWPGSSTLAGSTAPQRQWPLPGVQLNRLAWPTGAARFAFGHFLADTEAVGRLVAAAYGDDGTSWNPLTLVMESAYGREDAAPESLRAALYLLPPQAMLRVDGAGEGEDRRPSNGLWLLPLVDDRYRWWFRDAGHLHAVGSLEDTLKHLLRRCLGIADDAELTGDDEDALWAISDVDDGYLADDASWLVRNWPSHHPACQVLDALAGTYGLRVVRGYDGYVRVQGVADARARKDADESRERGVPRASRRLGGWYTNPTEL